MIAGLLMISIGLFFLTLFMMKYMNINDVLMYEDDEEYKSKQQKEIYKFKRESIPAIVLWTTVILAGIIIVIINLLERISFTNPL